MLQENAVFWHHTGRSQWVDGSAGQKTLAIAESSMDILSE